jgi:hypothetical protein
MPDDRSERRRRMSNFKVGDRVKIKTDSGWDDLEGLPGTLIESDNTMYLHLKFDAPAPAHLEDFFPVEADEIEKIEAGS